MTRNRSGVDTVIGRIAREYSVKRDSYLEWATLFFEARVKRRVESDVETMTTQTRIVVRIWGGRSGRGPDNNHDRDNNDGPGAPLVQIPVVG